MIWNIGLGDKEIQQEWMDGVGCLLDGSWTTTGAVVGKWLCAGCGSQQQVGPRKCYWRFRQLPTRNNKYYNSNID